MKNNKLIPKCLAIVVCEGVVEDVTTHNKCILNIFNEIRAFNFPTVQDRLTVFISLVDGYGSVPIKLEFSKDGETNPVLALNATVNFGSPLPVVDLVFNLRSIPIPSEGSYAIKLYAHGEIFQERRIKVTKIQPDLSNNQS